MESRFEAPANKEFFNGIGEKQSFPIHITNDRNALAGSTDRRNTF